MNVDEFITIFSNPTITAIIGAIVGGFSALLPLYSIQYNSDRQVKKNIKRLIQIELDSYHDFLNELLTNGEHQDDVLFIKFGDKLIQKTKSMMPDGNFKAVNYRNLSGETKAKTFTTETLTKLEQVYRDIEYFRGFEIKSVTGSGFQFTASKVKELIADIKLVIQMVNKRWV